MNSLRKTPLGTPLMGAAGRCYSPLSILQTPPPIREEEPIPAAAAEPRDSRKVPAFDLNEILNQRVKLCNDSLYQQSNDASSSSLEGEGPTTPTEPQLTDHSQPAPPFFTPEAGLRRSNGIQPQLNYECPVAGAGAVPTAGRHGTSLDSGLLLVSLTLDLCL